MFYNLVFWKKFLLQIIITFHTQQNLYEITCIIILVLFLFRYDVPLDKKVDYNAILDFGDDEIDIINNNNNNNNNDNNNKHSNENFTGDW